MFPSLAHPSINRSPSSLECMHPRAQSLLYSPSSFRARVTHRSVFLTAAATVPICRWEALRQMPDPLVELWKWKWKDGWPGRRDEDEDEDEDEGCALGSKAVAGRGKSGNCGVEWSLECKGAEMVGR